MPEEEKPGIQIKHTAMAQKPHPTFINLPPQESNPDTPSEMPGTPTSTTTSLSALSTIAIKDGHRGHFPQGCDHGHGHEHHSSSHNLDAERADRISRLAGLERVSTIRAPPNLPPDNAEASTTWSNFPQTTPTSNMGFPINNPATNPLTPAYFFDSNGQPVAVTKMSTVGTASATESSNVGEGSSSRMTGGDGDEDMQSTHSNYRDYGSVTSTGGERDVTEEDMERQGFDDRMSDDGSASLVGFGEGAGSTVSGPIYHHRTVPSGGGGSGNPAWSLERSHSGLSEAVRRDHDTPMAGTETPLTAAVAQERRDARMMDGVAAEPVIMQGGVGADQNGINTTSSQEAFVDTTFRGPVSVNMAAVAPGNRESAETIVQRLDHGEAQAGSTGLRSPGSGGQALGQFYFEAHGSSRG